MLLAVHVTDRFQLQFAPLPFIIRPVPRAPFMYKDVGFLGTFPLIDIGPAISWHASLSVLLQGQDFDGTIRNMGFSHHFRYCRFCCTLA